MKNLRIYCCENSPDGIFTAIYEAWMSQYGHEYCKIQIIDELHQGELCEIFAEKIDVITDSIKATKVADSVRNKISEQVYQVCYRAGLACNYEKADDIYRFLIAAFHVGRQILNCLTNPIVMKVFEYNRSVDNEAGHTLEFLRFSKVGINILQGEREEKAIEDTILDTDNNAKQEEKWKNTTMEQEVMIAFIKPQHDVLSLIANHFADRFSGETFFICDRNRRRMVVHPPGQHCFLSTCTEEEIAKMERITEKEQDYRNLWKIFFHTISIKEKENHKLQTQNLPKRYRSEMVDFQ